jgi:mRNA interferase MazF
VVISQGDVCWADLPEPSGSGPGFRRPVVVIQGDALNRSRIVTAVCVPLTSNLRWADAPGNLKLRAKASGLPKDSVANVSQVVAIDKSLLSRPMGRLTRAQVERIQLGLDIVLGR